MAGISNYLENALLDATLRGVTYNAPSNVYLALFTSDPTDAGIGDEVAGGGYVRQEVAFLAPVNGEVKNDADVLFPIATSNWGTITHIGIYDAETDGNLLYYGPLNASKDINTGSQFKLPQEYLSLTLD